MSRGLGRVEDAVEAEKGSGWWVKDAGDLEICGTRAKSRWGGGAVVMAAGVVLLGQSVFGQIRVGGEAQGFSMTRNDTVGRKSVVKAERAHTLKDGRIQIGGLHIDMYGSDGKLNMVVQAPECLFDSANHIATSSGELSLKTADERLDLKGRGFRWQQMEGRLFISNSVETVIRKAMLDVSGGKRGAIYGPPLPPSKTVRAGGPGSTNDTIRIQSNQFDYDSEVALFYGHVRAQESEGDLECERLKVLMKRAGGGVERIEASQKVKIRQTGGEAEADEAVYDVVSDLITLSKKVRWKMEQRDGESEKLELNRKTRGMHAQDGVVVRLPYGSVLPEELLPAGGGKTNSAAMLPLAPRADGVKGIQTNEMVEVRSDDLKYAGTKALFSGHVRAVSTGSELTCEVLSIESGNTNRSPERIVATGQVKIEQGGSRLYGAEAVYQAAAGTLTLTGEPHWEIEQGPNQKPILGQSAKVVAVARTRMFRGLGGVKMTIPLQSAISVGVTFESKPAAAPDKGGAREMEVIADEMEHQEELTVLSGHVRTTEADSVLKCGLVRLLRVRGELVEIVAEDQVRVEQGDRRAFSDTAVYWVKEGLVELTGVNPRLVTPEREVRAEVLLVDRFKKTFRAKGKYYQVEIKRTAMKRMNEAGGAGGAEPKP